MPRRRYTIAGSATIDEATPVSQILAADTQRRSCVSSSVTNGGVRNVGRLALWPDQLSR